MDSQSASRSKGGFAGVLIGGVPVARKTSCGRLGAQRGIKGSAGPRRGFYVEMFPLTCLDFDQCLGQRAQDLSKYASWP